MPLAVVKLSMVRHSGAFDSSRAPQGARDVQSIQPADLLDEIRGATHSRRELRGLAPIYAYSLAGKAVSPRQTGFRLHTNSNPTVQSITVWISINQSISLSSNEFIVHTSVLLSTSVIYVQKRVLYLFKHSRCSCMQLHLLQRQSQI